MQFTLVDVAAYALILTDRHDGAAVTINFLRPARLLSLVAVATPLRAGRRPFTAEVRVTKEAGGRLISHATTYALGRSRQTRPRLPSNRGVAGAG